MRYQFLLRISIGLFLCLGISRAACAQEWGCPILSAGTAYSQAISFLSGLAGREALGNCRLELHVCNPLLPADSTHELIGDLLITSKDGSTNYFPIYAVASSTATDQALTMVDNQALRYRFKDKLFDSSADDKAGWQLDVIKDEHQQLLAIGAETSGWQDPPPNALSSTPHWAYNEIVCADSRTPWWQKIPGIFLTTSWFHWIHH